MLTGPWLFLTCIPCFSRPPRHFILWLSGASPPRAGASPPEAAPPGTGSFPSTCFQHSTTILGRSLLASALLALPKLYGHPGRAYCPLPSLGRGGLQESRQQKAGQLGTACLPASSLPTCQGRHTSWEKIGGSHGGVPTRGWVRQSVPGRRPSWEGAAGGAGCRFLEGWPRSGSVHLLGPGSRPAGVSHSRASGKATWGCAGPEHPDCRKNAEPGTLLTSGTFQATLYGVGGWNVAGVGCLPQLKAHTRRPY